MSASGNHGRVYAEPASHEMGLATIARAVAKPVSSFAGRTTHHAFELARRRNRGLQVRFTAGRRASVHVPEGDRHRIAADVHDLIMQDLSFALATARTLADDPASRAQAGVVVEASERALAGARDVVRGLLAHDEGEPLVQVVEASVRAAARGAPIQFLAVGAHALAKPDGPTVHTLIHVAREAVTNAVKHSGPQTPVDVVFERGEEWRLTVRDRGSGFDPARDSTGFGLESMQARAQELGGIAARSQRPRRGQHGGAHSPMSGGEPTIVIADDNQVIRLGVRMALMRGGFRRRRRSGR